MGGGISLSTTTVPRKDWIIVFLTRESLSSNAALAPKIHHHHHHHQSRRWLSEVGGGGTGGGRKALLGGTIAETAA